MSSRLRTRASIDARILAASSDLQRRFRIDLRQGSSGIAGAAVGVKVADEHGPTVGNPVLARLAGAIWERYRVAVQEIEARQAQVSKATVQDADGIFTKIGEEAARRSMGPGAADLGLTREQAVARYLETPEGKALYTRYKAASA